MADDHASTEPQSEQDHSTAEVGDQTQQASERRVAKVVQKLLMGWRALAFLLIVLVVGYYAFYYKALSDPGSESKQLANSAPQEVDFFVSNPNVSVDVSILIFPQATMGQYLNQYQGPQSITPSTPQIDHVSMTVHAPSYIKSATVLMLISAPPASQVGRKFPQLENIPLNLFAALDPSDQQTIEGYSTAAIPINLREPAPDGYTIGFFLIGNDIEQTNAYLFGHLPAVGTVDQLVNRTPLPILAETYKNAPYRVRDIVLDPPVNSTATTESAISNVKSYTTPYGGPGELFWTPAELSIAETQTGVAATIANQQINYMTPTGHAAERDYVWQGSTSLDPVFQTTNNDALQSESNYAFLSGIFFGVAGAAAIAFVQEIPETFPQSAWWSRRKRKRKSSSQNAASKLERAMYARRPRLFRSQSRKLSYQFCSSPLGLSLMRETIA